MSLLPSNGQKRIIYIQANELGNFESVSGNILERNYKDYLRRIYIYMLFQVTLQINF